MYTLSQLRDEFLLLKKDLSDVDNDVFISWCRNIQRYIYRRLVDTDPTWYIKEQNYTVFNGVQTLPTDFGDMKSMDTGFFLIDNNGTPTTRRLFPTNFGSNQPGFYLNGKSNVQFFGFNTSKQYILRYTPATVGVTAISDYFTIDGTINTIEIVPDDYLDFIIKALDVRYTEWDEEVSAESYADARFIRVMDDLFTQLQRTPQVYDMNPFNQIF
jgi:hypothetical protein